MKNIILSLLAVLLVSNTITAQQVTLNFTVDNIFSAYVGNTNSVTQNKVPANRKDGSQIFNSTSVTSSYNAGDWFYIIAWSDDSGCQGMIGEIKYNGRTFPTGDNRWQVFPTGKNLNTLNQAPSSAQINQQIAVANRSRGWRTPASGPTNANTKEVCRAYPRPVTGISNNAKWVWHNSKSSGSPFFPGYNHGEYLIFRYPMKSIGGGGEDGNQNCCDELRIEIEKLKIDIRNLQGRP